MGRSDEDTTREKSIWDTQKILSALQCIQETVRYGHDPIATEPNLPWQEKYKQTDGTRKV